MSEGPGFLEFFILEASDYVEQLDGLLLGGSSNGPDANAMQRVARALRGTATMAKLPTFAEVAGGVERVGRAMQEGVLSWDPALGGALVAAVDDLKALLHSARNWSPAEDQRATARTAELARFAPPRPFTPPSDRANARSAVAGSAFLSAEATNIAAGIELLTTRGGAADTAANLLGRVRALRGVAGVKEVGPLSDVLEATEDAARPLESAGATLTPESRRLLDSAAEYLRVLSSSLRFDGDVNAPSAARDAFLEAQEAWAGKIGDEQRVVPVSSLFYVDGGPGLVEAAQNPPTSAAERFRLELVSHGEHLRQIADAARHAVDQNAQDRARRDLRRALRALQSSAASFGEQTIADLIGIRVGAPGELDARTLASLDELAAVLAQPTIQTDKLITRLREFSGVKAPSKRTSAETREIPVESIPDPVRRAPESPASAPTPLSLLDSALGSAASLIDSGLAALEGLSTEPWVAPVAIPEEAVVPIESLLYRGRAALDRAAELREQMRRDGSTIDKADLEELFDLLELARAE